MSLETATRAARQPGLLLEVAIRQLLCGAEVWVSPHALLLAGPSRLLWSHGEPRANTDPHSTGSQVHQSSGQAHCPLDCDGRDSSRSWDAEHTLDKQDAYK